MLVQRLGMDNQKDPKYVEEFIKLIKEHDGCCDEVWLTTNYGYPSLETHKSSAAIIEKTAKEFRDNGIKVSLQVANTLGHGEYMSSRDCSGLVFEGSSVGKMVDISGKRNEYCFCWNDKFFREYIAKSILAYADIKPEVLWLDDDYRFFHHGSTSLGCFCDDCIAKFNKINKSSYTREDLQTLIYSDEKVRKAYFKFMCDGLADFTRYILTPFHKASPDTVFAVQYGDMKTELAGAIKSVLYAMKEVSGKNPQTRPGGGTYNDYNPNDLIWKCLHGNWLNHNLPDFVEEKLPEIENLPDTVFGKSGAGTCLESTLYLACGGNTGVTYAMMMRTYEPFSYHGTILAQFKAQSKYWKELSDINRITVQSGVNFVYAEDTLKENPDKPLKNVLDFHIGVYDGMVEFSRVGIPVAYDGKKEDGVYFLTKHNARYLSDEQIEFLLTKPVICDAYAFKVINEKYKEFDVSYEQLSSANALKVGFVYAEHAINGGLKGLAYPKSFYNPTLYVCTDYEKPSVEVVSFYTSRALDIEPLCSGIYPYGISDSVVTSKRGVKWAVSGSDLTNPSISFDRRNQLVRLIEYLSPNTIKAVVESKIQMMVMPRETREGKLKSVSLVNVTIGNSGEISLRITKPVGENFRFVSQYGGEVEVKALKDGDDYILTLPNLEPYSVGTVIIK